MTVNRMPAAEVEVSADLVRLLADQHPDLARLPVEFLANGWDNELYRVGDELVARLPRRALGAQIITNEQRWLPGLAPGLPLPIPYPERTGAPGRGYPYSWSVVPYLPGVPAVQASSFDPARAWVRLSGTDGRTVELWVDDASRSSRSTRARPWRPTGAAAGWAQTRFIPASWFARLRSLGRA